MGRLENDKQLQQLIEECACGNPAAQRKIFEQYMPAMLRLAKRFTADPMEAEDMVMIGFFKVFKKINSFNAVGSFEGWIKAIIINSAITVYRKNQKKLDSDSLCGMFDQTIEAHNKTNIDYLYFAINSLPQDFAIPFALYAIEGYSHQEIGRKMQISPSLSKVRVSRARKVIKNNLKREEERQILMANFN
jgi:RNA polymerase sigma factor (sigma-70 family)